MKLRSATTLTYKRTSLVELDSGFGFLQEVPGDGSDLVTLHLPLRSQRMQIEHTDKQHLLHPSTQSHLRNLVENDLFVKYGRAEKLLKTQLLRARMDKWTASNMYKRKETKSVRRLMPEVLQLTVPDSWFYRKGLQTIAAYLWYGQQRKVKSAFWHWRYMIDAERNLKAKLFSRWCWKASAWRLNRMKAARLVQLTAGLAEQVKLAHWAHYYQRWLEYDQKMKMRIKMRLLFRCWKIAVQSLKAARRRAVRSAFLTLQDRARTQRKRIQHIQQRKHLKLMRFAMEMWLLLLRKKAVLRRLFCIGDRGWMLRALSKWKTLLGKHQVAPRLSSPRRSQSVELSPRSPLGEVRVSQKAAFQSGDQLVYRKVTTVRRPCQINRCPVSTSQSSNPSLISLRERMEWRLGVVKDLDKSFSEYEQPTKPLWKDDHKHTPEHSHRNTPSKGSMLYGGALGGGGSARKPGLPPQTAVKVKRPPIPRTPQTAPPKKKPSPWITL